VLVGLVACVTVLTGCSATKEANDSLPTATSTPTEAALPPLGPEDLPMPDEARTQDAAGAEAFVRYYIALINRTSEVMDAEPLREFSDSCMECERLARNTEEAAAAGHDFEQGEITIREIGQPLVEGKTAQLAIRVDQAPFRVIDQAGAPVEGGADAILDIPCGIALTWNPSDQRWTMNQMTFG
jgi:hypothetical protein